MNQLINELTKVMSSGINDGSDNLDLEMGTLSKRLFKILREASQSADGDNPGLASGRQTQLFFWDMVYWWLLYIVIPYINWQWFTETTTSSESESTPQSH